MTELKNKLLELFEGKNSKSYPRLLGSKKDLLEKVNELTLAYKTESINETLWCIMNQQIPNICGCGNKAKFASFTLGYRDFCGGKNGKCWASKKHQSHKLSKFWKNNPEVKEQMLKHLENSVLEKYGVTNVLLSSQIKEKVKNTNLDKYGVEYPLQSNTVKEKIKNTNLDKYGVEYPFQSEQIRNTAKIEFEKNYPDLPDAMYLARSAFLNIHGVNPFAVEEIKNKIQIQKIEKYGYKHALQKHLPIETIKILEDPVLFRESIKNLTIFESALKLGVDATTITRRAAQHDCRESLSKSTRSKWEYKITQLLLDLGMIENIDFIRGDRKILLGKELDFYFPKLKVAIEVGSVFYHSELSSGRGERYHYNKWKNCKDVGIDLYQYWDFELLDKWDIITSKIRYLLKKNTVSVGARKIEKIALIDLAQEKQFLNNNHIQGFTSDRMLTLGAFYQNKLVAVLSLDFKSKIIEVVRYATIINENYPGLFSKMLSKCINYIPNDVSKTVITISDNRHSNGNLYIKSGFTMVKSIKPEYYYTKNYHLIERKKRFTKAKIQKKFNIDIKNKTEWELMQELNYDRIWDAGKIYWKLNI